MAQRIDVFSRVFAHETRQSDQVSTQSKTNNPRFYLLTKRALDMIVSAALLILLSPLLLAVAVAIKLDSPGPVLLKQKRVGKDGRVFGFFKFRSMYQHVNCEDHRQFARQFINGHHDTCAPNDDSLIYKPANHHNVTRIGRILRRTSMDELPQLFNVLKGDMSLVGPRPSIYFELDEYNAWHKRRLQALPGLTGWAQIHGRSALRFDDIVSLDLEYIRARSLRMDLAILARTIPVVLSGKGAG